MRLLLLDGSLSNEADVRIAVPFSRDSREGVLMWKPCLGESPGMKSGLGRGVRSIKADNAGDGSADADAGERLLAMSCEDLEACRPKYDEIDRSGTFMGCDDENAGNVSVS